jgi:hypothetical protein
MQLALGLRPRATIHFLAVCFVAADCARAAKESFGVFPPLDLDVADWIRAAAALVILPLALVITFSVVLVESPLGQVKSIS